MAVALMGCRANPGFMLLDGDGEDRESESDADSLGESAGSEDGVEICEPRILVPADDCRPWEALPLWLFEGFNVATTPMLVDLPCDQLTQLLVKRVGTDLRQCASACDSSCDTGLNMDVTYAGKVALLAPLLPAEGECAKLWHVGRPQENPESAASCRTTGFALLDDTPEAALRVVVAFNTAEPDPFAGVPGSPVAVTVTENTVGDGVCPGMENTACDATGAIPKLLDFRFGECSFQSSQGQIGQELQAGGEHYVLENHSAYDCINTGPTVYRWWLRRGT